MACIIDFYDLPDKDGILAELSGKFDSPLEPEITDRNTRRVLSRLPPGALAADLIDSEACQSAASNARGGCFIVDSLLIVPYHRKSKEAA